MERYRSGLLRLSDLDFSTLIPSHGEPLDRAAGLARLTESLDFVDRAQTFVEEYVHRHDTVRLGELADDLGTRLGPYGGVNVQTVSVVKAHLDHLVRTGEARAYWQSTRRPTSATNPGSDS